MTAFKNGVIAMMKLEEYIFKRKKEDGIDECDYSKRLENTRICVNYIFEYFNNYLEMTPADEKTILHEQRVEKYKESLRHYSTEIQDWLASLYSAYGKHMNRNIKNYIVDPYYLLYDSESEFRAMSYEVYPKLIKRFKFLDGQSEMVYLFLKDHHQIESRLSIYGDSINVYESIDKWIIDTFNRYNVNLFNFCCEWAHYYYHNPELWPKGYKTKSKYYEKYCGEKDFNKYDSLYWDYDYKQKSNLFNLDTLYRNMPKKSFTRGKKQEFEVLLMYCWLHQIQGDNEYWDMYLENVIPSL